MTDQHVGAEWYGFAREHHVRRTRLRRRLEPTQLVELAIVGRVRLGMDRHDTPAVDSRGAVVERVIDGERHAHREHHVERRSLAGHHGECVEAGVEQRALEEQVAAGVAG